MHKIKNVLLITVDALRPDHLGCCGYSRNTAPNLDRLAKGGILFTQAISNAPLTHASFQSIFTSTYPMMYGGYEGLYDGRTTIAEVLKENGFDTAGFHSNPFLSGCFGYGRGFDTFQDFLDMPQKRVAATLPYVDADTINGEAISWLKSHKRNFFLWMHYMDVHEPYTPAARFLRYFSKKSIDTKELEELNKKIMLSPSTLKPDELQTAIDLYDAEIRYVDDAIGRLVSTLKRMRILDDTLIVITADHGTEFLEHGEVIHRPKLYDELLRVPLIMVGPSIFDGPRVIGEQVGLIDLPSSIIGILGLGKCERFLGTSFCRLIHGEAIKLDVISEISTALWDIEMDPEKRKTSYRTPEWKFIMHKESGMYELYNLQEDPKELVDLAMRDEPRVNLFKDKLCAHIAAEERTISDSVLDEKERIKAKIKWLKKEKKVI